MKRKLHVFLTACVCALALTAGVPAYAAEREAMPVKEAEMVTDTMKAANQTSYQVKIVLKGNGGKGSMSQLTVVSGKKTKLPANTFKKEGYVFAGWATEKEGSVIYANKADVSALASQENNGSKITLYAQWKLAAPKLKKLTSTPSHITAKFSKNKVASGYEIQYSRTGKFREGKTFTTTVTDKNATSAILQRVVPNKTYYVRIRSYKTKNKIPVAWSDWSERMSVKVANGKTLTNLTGKNTTAIEADIKLKGSGTGYHAKVVMGNATSAVSFGMQFDEYAQAPYGGKCMALIENVSSNDAGGQTYDRPGNVSLKLNKTYHFMMTTNGDGTGDVYIDYKKIGSYRQDGLKNLAYLRIEVAGRLNGDSVDAEFSNIKIGCKTDGAEKMKVLGDNLTWSEIPENKGLKFQYDKKTNKIRMYGTIEGLNGDWDSDYLGASYILQFH